MRLLTYVLNGQARPGVLRGEDVIDLTPTCTKLEEPPELLSLIRRWDEAEAAVREAAANGPAAANVADVRLLAPIPRPAKNVLCLGRNYRDHVAEGARFRGEEQSTAPPYPVFFTKPPTSVIGPRDAIFYDASVSTQLDYEVELAVVFGRTGTNVHGAADVYAHVFGYTILNDVSARDVQYRHGQFFKGKALDRTCPLGPWIVTKDEIPNPHDLGIRLRVNGELRQSANTGQMIFDIVAATESLTQGMTIEAGDIFATGTPAGVGMGMQPPQWLLPGDLVECEIDRIGVLRNVVGGTPA